ELRRLLGLLLGGQDRRLLLPLQRDVADGHGDADALVVPRGQRAQPDLDREEGAVPAPGAELAAGSHPTRPGRAVVSLAQRRVSRPDVVGDQHLDGLADELLSRVAEELLALRV